MSTSGTLTKVLLDGLEFSVMADADVTQIIGAYTSEDLPTSGKPIRKMTRRTESREGLVIGCSDIEADILRELSERQDDISISYTTAAGSTYRTTGWINFENYTTADNKATVKLFPREKWELF